MKRVLLGLLTASLAVSVVPSGASANKPKKAAASKKKAESAPNSQKIAESMGDVRWGMSKEDVVKYFTDKVKEKYRPLLAKSKDAVAEDRMRQQARQEIEAIKKGTVDFDGRSTGWDVSFLKGEFTHGNDESMVVVRDANSQNFFFFIGGKLWKWYKAFDASVFPAGNFDTFAGSVQRKFGGGKDVQGDLRPGEGKRHWIEWQDKQTRLRAVDETGFYGFYCLVFEEKSTVDNLARLRSHTDNGGGEKRHAMVEAVTTGGTANPDDSPNIVDRITGRMRQNEQAPQPSGGGSSDSSSASASSSGAKGKGKGGKGSASTTSSAPVDSENDPISGLGL